MNIYTSLILLKEKDRTVDLYSCNYDNGKYKVVFNDKRKAYIYNRQDVKWLYNPEELDIIQYSFKNKSNFILTNIEKALLFKDDENKYIRIFFKGGTNRTYNSDYLRIIENPISYKVNNNFLDYYKEVATKVGLKIDATNILEKELNKIDLTNNDTVLSKYFSDTVSSAFETKQNETTIFPFGCNLSQMTAVKNAFSNSISVIEGPPGTGKTQTILNIIANIVMRGKTVAVVSNNNPATDNVYEKLQKYGFDYLAAQLGKTDNKKDFIDNKQQSYPEFWNDYLSCQQIQNSLNDIKYLQNENKKMLKDKNRLAILKSYISSLETEKNYFDQYYLTIKGNEQNKSDLYKLSSNKILQLWFQCQKFIDENRKISLWFRIKCYFLYKVSIFGIFSKPVVKAISFLQNLFYNTKIKEVKQEITDITNRLNNYNFENKMKKLTDTSFKVLKAVLANKYGQKGQRKIFNESDLWNDSSSFLEEYPIILSTTYSIKSSLNNTVYDYVIVDEASQVDLATGILAMSCAKNIVIVGDLKQLPNVIKDNVKKSVLEISNKWNIPLKYRHEENSLLSSVVNVFKNVPRTLLREHYRCHPKIIDFCNKKFYNNELIIMTNDKGEDDVIKAHITTKGNHARGHYNQRQIDEITNKIMPELLVKSKTEDIGVIAPYNDQTSAISEELGDVFDISTVHKFQGREKDDIIISTVDNAITEFTDNPNMLNVAVSRAKNRLRLVVSDNDKNENTNIGDLLKYIQYNNFEVKQSEIYSVFDMLYESYSDYKRKYLSKYKKISNFDSENLMYCLIKDVISQKEFLKLGVVDHYLLNSLIRDKNKLTNTEYKYINNKATHVDFLILNKINSSAVLAIEVDGYQYHEYTTNQHQRDLMKDSILKKYGIPLLRFNTTGSGEKEILERTLKKLLEIEE